MTTVQLLARLARRSRTGDFSTLNMSEQMDLLQAANAGIQEVFGFLPNSFKELTEPILLPAPQTISVAVTQYSALLSSDVFTAEQIGRSVRLDGDENWNQVLDTNRLLLPYMGTSGTVAGTVYGDGWYSTRYPFERIIGNPRFPNAGPTTLNRGELVPLGNDFTTWPFQQQIGCPQYWWVQTLGTSQGNEPMLVLRVTPSPDTAYTLRLRVAYHPKRLVLADYSANTAVPVPDHLIERALIPIALEALMTSPVWDGKGDPKAVVAAADAGRRAAELQMPRVDAPAGRVFTPVGF